MANKKHTKREIISILKKIDDLRSKGSTLKEACLMFDIRESTYYRWKRENEYDYGKEILKEISIVDNQVGRKISPPKTKKKIKNDSILRDGCLGPVIIIGGILSIIIVLFMLIPSGDGSTGNTGSGGSKVDAWVIATNNVKDKLIDSTTAEFCSVNDADISYETFGGLPTWTVSGWVKAENSLGMMIRNDFTVIIEYESTSSNRSRIIYMRIGDFYEIGRPPTGASDVEQSIKDAWDKVNKDDNDTEVDILTVDSVKDIYAKFEEYIGENLNTADGDKNVVCDSYGEYSVLFVFDISKNWTFVEKVFMEIGVPENLQTYDGICFELESTEMIIEKIDYKGDSITLSISRDPDYYDVGMSLVG